MNYSESQSILEKIKSSNNILLNCHHNPDADSVGSALGFFRLLKHMGKKPKIISSTKLPVNLNFLFSNQESVEIVDFATFDFTMFDLMITNDSSSWARVSGNHDMEKPNMFIINVDHHKTNQKFGDINLIVEGAPANSEILYFLFKDLGFNFDIEQDYPDLSTPLLTGIIGDTGAFRFPETDGTTLEIASELMKFTDKNKIIFNLYQSYQENHVKVWQEIMKNLVIDKVNNFAYSFIDKSIMQANGFPENSKAEISDMIFQSIDGTKFGFVGAESEDGYISVSFRARENVDVSVVASKLGGGGHKWASAARVNEGSFESSKNKIIAEAIEFSRNA